MFFPRSRIRLRPVAVFLAWALVFLAAFAFMFTTVARIIDERSATTTPAGTSPDHPHVLPDSYVLS